MIFSLDQIVRIPTRLNNILDPILTANPNLFRNSSTVTGLSDHEIVTTDLNSMASDIDIPVRHN